MRFSLEASLTLYRYYMFCSFLYVAPHYWVNGCKEGVGFYDATRAGKLGGADASPR